MSAPPPSHHRKRMIDLNLGYLYLLTSVNRLYCRYAELQQVSNSVC